MKAKTGCIPVVMLAVALAVSSHAQEAQVPMDEAGKLQYIDMELEQSLGLFADYGDFREARLFQVSDTTFVLEIYYQSEGQIFKARLALSPDEVADLRRRVTEGIELQVPRVVLDQTGRSKLLVGATALSLVYYGWAVPLALDVGTGKTVAALYMFTSGAGFFIPFFATSNIAVTDAAATLSLYGGTRGIVHGFFLDRLLFGKESSWDGMVGLGIFGSMAEAISGFALADRLNMSTGTVEMIGVGGDLGLGLGLGTAHLAGFLEEDNERSAASSILLGSGAGLLAGRLLAYDQSYTAGDAHIVRATEMLGAYVPLAGVDIVGTDNAKVYTAASMVGSVVGVGLGHRLTRGRDFTAGEGTLINLGELAGGLVGLGFAYLASSDGGNSELYLTSSSLGAIGGFCATYYLFAQSARTTESSSRWNIGLTPEGLIALGMSERLSPAHQTPIPFVRLDFRFCPGGETGETSSLPIIPFCSSTYSAPSSSQQRTYLDFFRIDFNWISRLLTFLA